MYVCMYVCMLSYQQYIPFSLLLTIELTVYILEHTIS